MDLANLFRNISQVSSEVYIANGQLLCVDLELEVVDGAFQCLHSLRQEALKHYLVHADPRNQIVLDQRALPTAYPVRGL